MNDNQTPRDWLLARHRAAEPKLDALRRAVLPSSRAERHPAWAWRLFIPVATGLAAVLTIGIFVYRAKPPPAAKPIAVVEPSPVPRAEPPKAVAAPSAPSSATWTPPAPVLNPVVVVRKEGLAQSRLAQALGPIDPTQTFVTDVFFFNHALAHDIAPTVESALDVAGGAKVMVDARANALVITERSGRMYKLRPLLGELDRTANPVAITSALAASGRVPEPSPGVPAPTFPTRTPRQVATAANSAPDPTRPASDTDVGVVVAGGNLGRSSTPLYPPSLFKDSAEKPAVDPSRPETQPGWRPVSTWTNAGADTPSAAMETWLWADVNRRPDVWLATVVFSDSARAKILAYYDGLPEAERAKYSSPAEMYALMAMGMHPLSWTGMGNLKETVSQRRTSERQPTDGPVTEVVVSLDWQWADGRVRPDSRTFRRVGDGWKMPITDNMVDGVLNFYRSRTLPEPKKGTFRRVPG